ncbi:MAG: hypothetical protein NTZ65_02835 [Candidatus Berkelbacteria bacterium]|nr:hypothetical protein [Candidatus Berkelbacteria bacterium]
MKKYLPFIIVFFVALTVYILFAQKGFQYLNNFSPLAQSFLNGRLDVDKLPNLTELVENGGKYFVVYPPMPAVVLMPLVAVLGANFNVVPVGVLIGALSVALFYLLASNFTDKMSTRILTVALFGFGTNFFYTAEISSSWYFAHTIAVFFLIAGLLFAKNKHAFLGGLMLGFAFLSRLPTILAFPLFLYLLTESEKKERKLNQVIIFFAPILAAVFLFGLYNYLRFGSFLQTGYSLIPNVSIEPWYREGVFSLTYIPRQLQAIFLAMPKFSLSWPFFLPSPNAMALWLTTPALILLFFTKFKNKIVLFSLLSALLVAFPSLIHGTVGFTQFGYRFSLDYIVFLLIPLVFAFDKVGYKIASALVGLSIAINVWVLILFQLGIFKT